MVWGVLLFQSQMALQVNGVTVAAATPQPLVLTAAPVWTPPNVVGVYALGPVEVLAPGGQFQLPVFGNAQKYSVEGFQLRIEFETDLISVVAVQSSGLFQYASQQTAPLQLCSFMDPAHASVSCLRWF